MPKGLTLRWIFAAAAALSLLSSAIAYHFTYGLAQPSGPWYRLLVLNTVYWHAWAIFAPAIGYLSIRFPIERGLLKRSLPVHFVGLTVFALTHIAVMTATQFLVRGGDFKGPFGASLRRAVLLNIDWEMGTYLAIAGVAHALVYYETSQQRTLRAAQLEAKLAEAQLQSLQQQLHPHFFFNTLHAISTLMHRDVDAADRMLTRLADMLRLSLQRIGLAEVPLRDELEFLEKYVEIECTRFEDRLSVRFDVAPETLDALVPNLILQPLVENAVRHGIAPRGGAGRVELLAWRDQDKLLMEVRDDGVGLTEDAFGAVQKGIGVSTTRARLAQRYGSRHRFEFIRRPGGLTVRIAVPWATAAGVPAGAEVATT